MRRVNLEVIELVLDVRQQRGVRGSEYAWAKRGFSVEDLRPPTTGL